MTDNPEPAPAEETPEARAAQERAIDAAMAVFRRAPGLVGLMAPPRHLVVEALEAASTVMDEYEEAAVQRMLGDSGFVSLEHTDDGERMLLRNSATLAAAIVHSFDALVRQNGFENYLEQEFTITDPATEQAADAGLPVEQWPPHRRYTFIVVKPDGKTPHQLRAEAELRAQLLETRIEAARDKLSSVPGPAPDGAFATLESAVEYVIGECSTLTLALDACHEELGKLIDEVIDAENKTWRAAAAQINAIAGDDAWLTLLIDYDGEVGEGALAVARGVLRELAAQGGPLDEAANRPLPSELSDEQIGAYWDRHLAQDVADIPDRDAVEQMRTRYITDVRGNPHALRQITAARD